MTHQSDHPGSSPRMRGAQLGAITAAHPVRIIPAYAGSTSRELGRVSVEGDHPRVCGEHKDSDATDVAPVGSSPRMRGALRGNVGDKHVQGIIPAYAGSTDGWTSRLSAPRDHPRVCGEHMPAIFFPADSAGSSPRMRGARRTSMLKTSENGIIPAYAGSTRRSRFSERSSGDHPRVCGEHFWTGRFGPFREGSSPRMRGARGPPGGQPWP